MKKWQVLSIIFSLMGLAGCANPPDLKAPCGYSGQYCGQKIAINHTLKNE